MDADDDDALRGGFSMIHSQIRGGWGDAMTVHTHRHTHDVSRGSLSLSCNFRYLDFYSSYLHHSNITFVEREEAKNIERR
jgi:hypothetical protein